MVMVTRRGGAAGRAHGTVAVAASESHAPILTPTRSTFIPPHSTQTTHLAPSPRAQPPGL
eukprot:262202-Rhodomonas_salina.1